MFESDDNFLHQEEKQCKIQQNKHSKYLNSSLLQIRDNDRYLDAPREIPTKSYSLAPDLATGWRPKKKHSKPNFQNVFPLNFANDVVDLIIKAFSKKNSNYALAYLGPRKINSYQLHENRNYPNPYPLHKKIQAVTSQRAGIGKNHRLQVSNLEFFADFQCGNLDVAIKVSDNEYDLFMRVDSNTRGHTNWYYFEVRNREFTGEIKFNFCNFRRTMSLYQRGMKPFVLSEKTGNEWGQKGYNVLYEKKPLRYQFLYQQEQQYLNKSLSTYYTLTFTYNFQEPHDKVQFAYGIPYTYSYLLNFIREISISPQVKYETGWKTLSGLEVPVIQITDFEEINTEKRVVLVAARIHPGQSNASYVCHGFIKSLLADQPKIKQMLKQFQFFIVPMVNPDGVVTGNYRTSLFGKDLNRTFNQNRKYAFPQSLNLVLLAKRLKKQHKQRFTTYLDLHGHSVKKNIFFYGPDYSISHSFYFKSRQLGKILGNLSPMFRYYSCIFRISDSKSTTARAILNRVVNIPFTYTIQSSNGAYYDSLTHSQNLFTAKNWMEMGRILVKGLQIWSQTENFLAVRLTKSVNEFVQQDEKQLNIQKEIREKQPPGKQKLSDDQISQGGSDSQPEDQDLNEEQLQFLQKEIEGKKSPIQQRKSSKKSSRELQVISPQKTQLRPKMKIQYDWSQNLRQPIQISTRKQTYRVINRQRLPPLYIHDKSAQFLGSSTNKKRSIIIEGLKNLVISQDSHSNLIQKRKRLSISQLMISSKQTLSCEESELLLTRKPNKRELIQKMRKRG